MPRRAPTRALALGLALAPACKPDRAEPEPTADEIVQELLDALPSPHIDCGHVDTTSGCQAAQPQLDAMEACLRDALAACEPALARVDAGTLEGYSNPEHYIVDANCTITQIVDWTDDPYGGCRLWRRTCAGILDIQGCPFFHIPCENDDETLLQLESCDDGG